MTQLAEFEVGAKVSPVFGDGVFEVESKSEADVILRDSVTRRAVRESPQCSEYVAWGDTRTEAEDPAKRLADMGVTISVNGGESADTPEGIRTAVESLVASGKESAGSLRDREEAAPAPSQDRLVVLSAEALAETRNAVKDLLGKAVEEEFAARGPETVDPKTGEILPAQVGLSGMPPRKPGIWPDVVVLGRTERVYAVTMSFGGSLELKSSNPEDVWLAEQLLLGNPVTLEVAVVTDRTAHQLVKGQVVGAARVGVFDASQAGETGFLRLQGENRRLRDAYERVDAAADAFSSALGDHLRKAGGKPPKDLEEAHWGLREAIAAARP